MGESTSTKLACGCNVGSSWENDRPGDEVVCPMGHGKQAIVRQSRVRYLSGSRDAKLGFETD